MIKRLSFVLLGVFQALLVQAQTCSIQADSFVCIDDIIGFNLQVGSGTPSTISWDLDDGKSSTFANPSASYSNYGPKQIQVTVNFNGGGSCQASKSIYVHDRPEAKFQFTSSSNYCLSQNWVCIEDLSQPGKTGSPLTRRVTLFGDGDADLETDPLANKQFCHKYLSEGPYVLVMETIDSKGCFTRYQDSIKIIKDVKALFAYELYGNCDTVSLCLENRSNMDSVDAFSYYWDYGNGVIDSTQWSGTCFTYRDSGIFSPSLVIQSSAQCRDTFKQRDIVNLNPIRFDIVKDKYQGCVGESFTFEDLRSQKDSFFWYIRRENNTIAVPLGQTNPITFSVGNTGKHYITLTARREACQKTFLRDSIEIFGPVAKMTSRNTNSCLSSDTVFFCDESNYTNSKGVKRLWTFNDLTAPSCTTDTQNGLNVGQNCRFSRDADPWHVFPPDSCVGVQLVLTDTITGCISEIGEEFVQGPRDTSKYPLKYTNINPCDGPSVDRMFNFWLEDYCGDFYIKADSLSADPFLKVKKGPYNHNYREVRSDDGWVTVGIILLAGDTSGYTCSGKTNTPLCLDTIWYHKYLKLTPQAQPNFTLVESHGCAPFNAQFKLQDTLYRSLQKAYWDWGDGSIDSFDYGPTDTLFSDFQHVYNQQGSYQASLILVNEAGCANAATQSLTLGHIPRVQHMANYCLNECIQFNDSIQYYNDSNYQWTNANRLGVYEKILWDWDDGDFDSISHPRHCFKNPGLHEVKMISTDSSGCTDTTLIPINIGGVKAGISQQKTKILCSEIVQFFDSSFLIDSSSGEQIAGWLWEWGDGSRASSTQNPFHFYSSYQNYTIRLVVVTTKSCYDTAYFDVEVQGPDPSFEIITDSIGCAPLSVEMKNTSANTLNWIWYFGDPDSTTYTTYNDSNVRFTYTKPGTYYVRLYGSDSLFNPATQNKQHCSVFYPDTNLPGQIARKVIVLPTPKADFQIPDTVCVNTPVDLQESGDPIYDVHRWTLEDGTLLTSTTGTSTVIFDEVGTTSVWYKPTYPPGPGGKTCPDSIRKSVEVVNIKADFEIDTLRSGPLDIYFINRSQNATRYYWDFGHPESGDRNASVEQDPYHNYNPDKGWFTVCLIAENQHGCRDTVCKQIFLEFDPHLFIPNVFTPADGNEVNEAFDIDIRGEVLYDLTIYNRYSQVVFSSVKDGEGDDGINWDGTNDQGEMLPAGVYYVVFRYRIHYRKEKTYYGTVTLIRH